MLKRILVGLAGTEYTTSAIRHAIALASTNNAEVTGVTVIDEKRLTLVGPVPVGGGAYAKDLAEDRMRKAAERSGLAEQQFLDACRTAGIRHRLVREVGEPFSHMVDLSRYHDLMVFGLRSLFEFDIVDDPHDALVRLVQAGVRPLVAASKVFTPIKKVLVAYSGSIESAKAMKRFAQLKLWPEAKVRVVTFEHEVGVAKQLVGDAADYCRAHGLDVEEAYDSNSAKDHLLPYASNWGADMTVVGNSSKSLLLRRVFGETALHAIQNTERPLFLAQ